jgi:hypothetical protein
MDSAAIANLSCTLPLPILEYIYRQPVADIGRKTVAVDVVDLLAEMELHARDRMLHKKWLGALQSIALPPAVVAAIRTVTPTDQVSSAVEPKWSEPSLSSVVLTLRRCEVEALLEAQSSSLALEFSTRRAAAATPQPSHGLLSSTNADATARQLLQTPPNLRVVGVPAPESPVKAGPEAIPAQRADSEDDDIPNDISSPARDVEQEGSGAPPAAISTASDNAPSVLLAAQPAEVFYIMNPQRCHQTHTPLILDRFSPSPSLALSVPAWALYERAEHQLENHIQIGISFDDASVLFSRAGEEFRTIPEASAMAGNCFVRSADCRRCVSDPDGQAELLVAAGEAYARGDDQRSKFAAVAALREAVRIYEKEGRPVKAAKHARQAAEFAVDGGAPMDGVTLLHYASNVLLSLRMTADARACLARATAVTVMDAGNYVEAIACLEKLADICPSEKEQSYSLFRALVVRMVCIPSVWGAEAVEAIMDCREVLSAYTDACPALLRSSENECVETAISGLLTENADLVESAFGKYVRSHTLEEWVEPLFWAIHAAALQRKSQHLRLYTL